MSPGDIVSIAPAGTIGRITAGPEVQPDPAHHDFPTDFWAVEVTTPDSRARLEWHRCIDLELITEE